MFSDQGEKQFEPHRNNGEDHFAEILFAPYGSPNGDFVIIQKKKGTETGKWYFCRSQKSPDRR
jgi:hypothetical protein